MSEPALAAVGLGSNLGDRRATILAAIEAIEAIPETRVLAVSGIIETDPLGPPGQGPYLNAAVTVRTLRSPRELLEELLAIEASMGRRRRPETRWGPRTIDLDLLLYADRVIDEPGLTVPHPRLAERAFALMPLAEIADSWVHPRLGLTIECLRDALAAAE